MNRARELLGENAVAALGVALIWILAAPVQSIPQDRISWSIGELVPPLRLVEEDFKKGFQKTFRFPRELNIASGTLSLSYVPGDLAPMHAVVDLKIQACDDCDTWSVSWSADLDPVDDDPEGRFPAMRFNQFADPAYRPVIKTTAPGCRIVPGSETYLVDIILVQQAEGAIYRDTYIRVRFDTSLKCWDPQFKKWFDTGWGWDGMFGPQISEGTEEEKSLAIEGCTDLLKGGKGQVTAKAKSEGGKYTWSSGSSSVLNVSGSGSSASVSARSTGRSVVRVEYETREGEKIEAEKAGSVVELSSVGLVPQIALIDDRGNSLPAIEVPIVQDPPDGDLLRFVAADPGIATVVNLGSVLQVQGIREGSTTAQAQTNCGVKTGPALKLEVVRCSQETVEKLRQELRMINSRLDSGRRQMAELTSNDEFNRADREGPDDVKDLAKSTAELISAGMGAAGKAGKAVTVSKGAETADSLWGLFNTMNDMAAGLASGDMDKVSGATFDATVQLLELTVVGVAKAAYTAGSAASKVGRDLGTMFGTADRIRELEEATRGTLKELEDVERRLYKVCGEKSSSPKKEPPPAEPPAKPAPAPKPEPSAKPAPPKTEPTQPPTEPPGEPKSDKPPTGGGGEKPPDTPPPRPAGGTVGLPLNCGCDSWRYKSWGSSGTGLIRLSEDLRVAGQCAEAFAALVEGFTSDLDLLSGALKDVSGARQLPVEQMKAKFEGFLAGTKGLSARLEEFSGQAGRYRSYLDGCGQTVKDAPELIRKASAAAGAEMIRK